MNMRLRTTALLATLCILFGMSAPVSSYATICCRCHEAGDTKDTTCVQTDTIQKDQCDTLPQKSQNGDLQDMVCENTTNCTPISQGTGGTCAAGPIPENQYKKPNGVVTNITEKPPELNIPIKGLQLSAGKVVGDYVEVPMLAQYIVTIYHFLLAISAIAAAIMIVYGGFKYIIAATGTDVKKGKGVIQDALIGLVLLFATYVILQTVNPETLAMNALKLRIIRPPDEAFFAENGTGDRIFSADAADRATYGAIQGDAPALSPSDLVDISSIPFDKSLGGPANMSKYCSSKAEAQAATTYEQKIKLLVRAVLGWEKVCVQNKLCVYSQASSTIIPNGNITGNPAPSFAVKKFIELHIQDGLPENLWAQKPECLDAWNKTGAFEKTGGHFVVDGMPECTEVVQRVYQEYFIDKFVEQKLFAGDCGSFAMELYRCAGAALKPTPREETYDNRTKKTIKTAYLSEKSLHKNDADSASILNAHMNENLLGLAASKGGIRFGDMVYICCGGSGSLNAHWFLYTGGRPDVPFTFIEMGGGTGVNVPGLGGLSGVHATKKWTLQDYINAKIKPKPFYSTSGRLLWTNKAEFDASKGLVFVWRPYADN